MAPGEGRRNFGVFNMSGRRKLVVGGTGAAALAMCAFIGCAATTEPPAKTGAGDPPAATASAFPSTYVGELKGAPAGSRVAVVVEGDAFTAYACSPDAEFNKTDARWFKGTLAAGKGTAAVDGREFAAEVKGNTVAVVIKGGAKEYTASAVEVGESEAGLYRHDEKQGDEPKVTGWILSTDGSVVGNTQVGTKVKNFTLPPKNFNGAGKVSQFVRKLTITNVKSDFNVGGGGENVDFTVDWDGQPGINAKIVSFEGSLRATYKTQQPVTKNFKLGADVRSFKARMPNILADLNGFDAKVVMVLQGTGQDKRQFRVIANKTGSF